NPAVKVSETEVNEIVIQVSKKMWIEYGEKLYNEKRFFSGNGTENKPYLINSVDDLSIMAYLINNYNNNSSVYYASCTYELKISLSLFEKFWTPIGVQQNPFNGTFIFGGRNVKDIYLTRKYSTTRYDGLFGYCTDNARFIIERTNFTILYIIIGLLLLLIILIITIIIVRNNMKRKKMERQSTRTLVG
ncbi:MAG: hypothetical protein IKA31_03695, partial [Clostridia bacterium]|nr:hypothetical protein [Clostridia bacterium]